MSETKFSPVDAAVVALLNPPTLVSLRAARIVDAAAARWCRDLGVPSVRTLAADLQRAPSSVLHGFESLLNVYAAVIAREWAALRRGWFSNPGDSAVAWLAAHVETLAAAHPAQVRLPALVSAAVEGANAKATIGQCKPLTPLLVLAAYASPRAKLPCRAELERIIAASGDLAA